MSTKSNGNGPRESGVTSTGGDRSTTPTTY